MPLIIKKTKEVEHADSKASSIAGEALSSIRMIIASGAEARVSKRYAGWIEESRKRVSQSGCFGSVVIDLFQGSQNGSTSG